MGFSLVVHQSFLILHTITYMATKCHAYIYHDLNYSHIFIDVRDYTNWCFMGGGGLAGASFGVERCIYSPKHRLFFDDSS